MRIRTLMLSALLLQSLLVVSVGVVLVRLGDAQDGIVRSQQQAGHLWCAGLGAAAV